MRKNVTYGNGAAINVTTPYLNGYNLTLDGTSEASQPFVRFVDTNVLNTLNSINVFGCSEHAMAFGTVLMNPFDQPGLIITNGVHLSHGNLTLGSSDGGTTTIGGLSVVIDHSDFTAWGGRYHADATVLKGAMIVANGSTADFSNASLQGNGTIYMVDDSTLDVRQVSAGLHMDVLNGGTLVVNDGMGFQGTIYETPNAVTDVLNAKTAVKEIFHQSTGVLDLVNQIGADVASLKFAGAATLYTTPNVAGGMDITTGHHVGSLPVIFIH